MSALRGCVQVGTLAVPLVVDGATPATIKRDDSTWLLTEEGGARVLHVTLSKAETFQEWPSVVV